MKQLPMMNGISKTLPIYAPIRNIIAKIIHFVFLGIIYSFFLFNKLPDNRLMICVNIGCNMRPPPKIRNPYGAVSVKAPIDIAQITNPIK
jgi:hypothetical protein